MSFELFKSSPAAASAPFISLTKDGFRLSAGFVGRHRLERATAVQLYFDRTKRAVGFEFPTRTAPKEGILKLRRHASGLVVRARSFFTSHGINPKIAAGRYEPREVKDRTAKRLFVIDLHARRTAVKPARRVA